MIRNRVHSVGFETSLGPKLATHNIFPFMYVMWEEIVGDAFVCDQYAYNIVFCCYPRILLVAVVVVFLGGTFQRK